MLLPAAKIFLNESKDSAELADETAGVQSFFSGACKPSRSTLTLFDFGCASASRIQTIS